MELFVIAILLTFAGAQERQLDGPQNTLSIVGSTVTLKCLSPSRNCNGIDWQKFLSRANAINIFKGPRTILNTTETDKDRYSVDNSSGCDLIIKKVKLKDAGRFICSAIMSFNGSSSQVAKTAYLIILDSQPKCTLNVSLNDTVEGDGVQLKCEATYNGTNRASMDWKGVTDAPATRKNENIISRFYFVVVMNYTAMSRVYSVVASAPEVPSFTCEASFAFETVDHYNGAPIVGLATNSIPNAICSTSAIKVIYSVRDVTLSPSYSNYPPGTIVTCAARGHPSPTFKWQENEADGPWMDIQNWCGSIFSVTDVSSKRYRCVAVNVMRGTRYHAYSREILFNDTDGLSSTMISVREDRLGFNSGIGIGVGIGFIVAILLASIVFAMLVRHKYLDLHPNPAVAAGLAQHQRHELSPSHQPGPSAAVNRSIPRTAATVVLDHESAYASLGEDRDASEYAALEQRQKAKPMKKSKP